MDLFDRHPHIPNQFITEERGVSVFLKREDLLHKEVSGNKFRKLKYNVLEAISKGKDRLLTFGGAYSNHIAATAAAGKLTGLGTIGIIRGDELGKDLSRTLSQNPTLKFAVSCGMQLEFISRDEYRKKNTGSMEERLHQRFGEFYLVPEGGTNALAVRGCEEILTPADTVFEFLCCAMGTGGTLSGIINASGKGQKVLGFPALKGGFLKDEVNRFTQKDNWEIITDYHFGGYAKVDRSLIEFINNFRLKFNVPLDPVYTGKMMYGIFDLIGKGYFSKNTRILAVHTGGLQGVPGMNSRLENKDLPQIII